MMHAGTVTGACRIPLTRRSFAWLIRATLSHKGEGREKA